MNEEDLYRQLDNVSLPTLKLMGHQRQLRTKLLAAGFPEPQQGLAGAINKIGGIMMHGLKSPQPVWRPLLLATVVLGIVIGLMWSAQSPSGQPQVVMAADTIMFSPELSKAVIANESFRDYNLIEFTVNGEIIASLYKNVGQDRTLTLEIEMEPGELTLAEMEAMGTMLPQGSDERQIEDIAQNDIRVQELLSQGASIKKTMLDLVPYRTKTSSKADLEGFNILFHKVLKNRAIVLLEQGNEHWIVRVDLEAGIVTALEKLTS